MIYALVAQLDRVLDSDSKGRWFESSQARQNLQGFMPWRFVLSYKMTEEIASCIVAILYICLFLQFCLAVKIVVKCPGSLAKRRWQLSSYRRMRGCKCPIFTSVLVRAPSRVMRQKAALHRIGEDATQASVDTLNGAFGERLSCHRVFLLSQFSVKVSEVFGL